MSNSLHFRLPPRTLTPGSVPLVSLFNSLRFRLLLMLATVVIVTVGIAALVPLGNWILGLLDVTVTVPPVKSDQPVFCTLIVTAPPSPASTIPSLSHDGVVSVNASDTKAALGRLAM